MYRACSALAAKLGPVLCLLSPATLWAATHGIPKERLPTLVLHTDAKQKIVEMPRQVAGKYFDTSSPRKLSLPSDDTFEEIALRLGGSDGTRAVRVLKHLFGVAVTTPPVISDEVMPELTTIVAKVIGEVPFSTERDDSVHVLLHDNSQVVFSDKTLTLGGGWQKQFLAANADEWDVSYPHAKAVISSDVAGEINLYRKGPHPNNIGGKDRPLVGGWMVSAREASRRCRFYIPGTPLRTHPLCSAPYSAAPRVRRRNSGRSFRHTRRCFCTVCNWERGR